jgi:AcrR family transcriptional regulator
MSDPRCQRFFQAGEPLMERFGYRKTTVEDICRQAGSSKRTFYELFQDKADFFAALLTEIVNDMTDRWERGLRTGQDPIQRLKSFLDLYAKVIRERPVLRLLTEEFELMGSFQGRLDDIRISRAGGPLERTLQEGVADGTFRKMDTRIATWLIFTLLDTVYLLLPTMTGLPGALEDPGLARETGRFILHGLGARPGE